MCYYDIHNPVNINIKKFQESSYDDSEDLRKAHIFVPLNKVSWYVMLHLYISLQSFCPK